MNAIYLVMIAFGIAGVNLFTIQTIHWKTNVHFRFCHFVRLLKKNEQLLWV